MLDIALELPVKALTAGMNLTLVVLADRAGGGVPVTLTTVAEGGGVAPSLNGVPFRIGETEEALTLQVSHGQYNHLDAPHYTSTSRYLYGET